MLPHKHFIISAASAVPVAMIAARSEPSTSVIEWFLVAGLVSALLDIDVLAIVLARGRRHSALHTFARNPIRMFTHFSEFMAALYSTGLIRVAMLTHFALWALVPVAVIFLAPEWTVPVVVAVITHALSDTPHITYLLSGRQTT